VECTDALAPGFNHDTDTGAICARNVRLLIGLSRGSLTPDDRPPTHYLLLLGDSAHIPVSQWGRSACEPIFACSWGCVDLRPSREPFGHEVSGSLETSRCRTSRTPVAPPSEGLLRQQHYVKSAHDAFGIWSNRVWLASLVHAPGSAPGPRTPSSPSYTIFLRLSPCVYDRAGVARLSAGRLPDWLIRSLPAHTTSRFHVAEPCLQ
jgi:hypothetical protein